MNRFKVNQQNTRARFLTAALAALAALASLSLVLISLDVFAADAQHDSLISTQTACHAFQERLKALPNVTSGIAKVPLDWEDPFDNQLIPFFWWKRKGIDPSFPPLAFIHGGPASNSWALLDNWKAMLADYPGDLIAFDERGEGCSKTLRSNLPSAAYVHYRVRDIVQDLEFLRTDVFGYKKWRVMGHSRGAAIVHYYLEMAPEGLESAHAMGFSIMPNVQSAYAQYRALGYFRTAQYYLEKHPEDAATVSGIRDTIAQKQMCWDGLDDRKICGSGAVDVLYQKLKYTSSWDKLHLIISSMVDEKSIHDAIAAALLGDVYAHFNYIVGTNGQDFANPDSKTAEVFKSTSDPLYVDPFLAEIRFVNESMAPTANIEWTGHVDRLDYDQIQSFLSSHKDFKYFLYAGYYDPIAPLEMYQPEIQKLGKRVHFDVLYKDGHDGWYDPIVLKRLMQRTPAF
jgi:pimeloyl-ACP methyl ester carboxylesterase